MSNRSECRVTPLGIEIDPGRLGAIGIEEGSRYYVVPVMGRTGTGPSVLSDVASSYDKLGPQFILSALEPDIWPSALRIEAFLERKRRASATDSIAAFLESVADAGVDVRQVHTAQLGYTLQKIDVVGFFPDLQPFVDAQLRLSDEAASKAPSTIQEGAASIREAIAVHAYRTVGRVLVPRLAHLQARLLAANIAEVRSGVDDSVISEVANYLNNHVTRAGDFIYYCSDRDFESHESIAAAFPVHEDAAAAASTTDLSPVWPRLPRNFHADFYTAEAILAESIPTPDMRLYLGSFSRGHRADPNEDTEAIVTRRVQALFQRHAMNPVLVSGMPAAGYERFHAWPGTPEASRPIQFCFTHGVGSDPQTRDADAAANHQESRRLESFLNSQLGPSVASHERFSIPIVGSASYNTPQRYARLRFVRDEYLARATATIIVRCPIAVSGGGVDKPNQCVGIIACICKCVADRSLRIEGIRQATLSRNGQHIAEMHIFASATTPESADRLRELKQSSQELRQDILVSFDAKGIQLHIGDVDTRVN